MRAFIVIPLLIIFFLPIQSEGSAEEKDIIVVLRYDDYSSLSSTDLEIRLINDLQNYKFPCTFGVIPFTVANQLDTSPQNVFPLSETKTILLKNAMKAGIVEVAQHGYSHQTISDKKIYSEFYGLNYDSQLKKIERGKIFLEEILNTKITTFIPPFNSSDLNTIRSLEKLGFSSISSSLDGNTTGFSKIRFLPETCSPMQLQNAVKTARNIPDPQPIIVVMFHGYDFLDIDKGRGMFTYKEFLGALNWISSQKDIRVMSINQAIHAISDLSAKRFLMNHAVKSSLHFMPPLLRNSGLNNSGLYFSSGDSLEIRDRNRFHTILFYSVTLLLSIAISFYTGFYMSHKSRYSMAAFRYGILSILVFFLFYTFQDLDIGYKGAIGLTVLFGVCIGLWSSFFIMKNRNLNPGSSSLKS